MELVYTGDGRISSENGVFSVLSDADDSGRHTAVLSVPDGISSNEVLSRVLAQPVQINSFKELLPRMNDIFIKLVTE